MTRWQEFRRYLDWHGWKCWHHWEPSAPGHKDICTHCGKRAENQTENRDVSH